MVVEMSVPLGDGLVVRVPMPAYNAMDGVVRVAGEHYPVKVYNDTAYPVTACCGASTAVENSPEDGCVCRGCGSDVDYAYGFTFPSKLVVRPL